jgi:CheY-like chemotaxis protein
VKHRKRNQILQALSKPSGVIVADDDRMIRDVLLARLKGIHQDVLLASNGFEAVALASTMQAELVVLDIKMPELDGIAACSQIRMLPGYKTTPIVMLTFDDSERAQKEASRAGATMLLAKPFGAATLMLTLSRYLSIDEDTLRGIHDSAVRAAGGHVFRRSACGEHRFVDR